MSLVPDAMPKKPYTALKQQQWVPPFSLHRVPEIFQQLKDIILRPHYKYVAACINNIVIHSTTCLDNLYYLGDVLRELWNMRLTGNPCKCHLGLTKAE